MVDYKYKVLWFIPRSGSTSFVEFLSKKYNIQNNYELFGQWNSEKIIQKGLQKKSVIKIQSEQFNLHKNIILPILEESEILVMIPRDCVQSYTSFIIAYTNSKRHQFKKDFFRPKDSNFKQEFSFISKEEALFALNFYSSLVESWIDNFKYFSKGKLVRINMLEHKPVWKLEEKIELIEDWDVIENHIHKKGFPLWEKVMTLIQNMETYDFTE